MRSYLVEGASACQDQAVIKPSKTARLSRAMDWAGLIPSTLMLAAGIREYRDSGSLGWLTGGVLLVLVSLWVVCRGTARRSGKAAGSP